MTAGERGAGCFAPVLTSVRSLAGRPRGARRTSVRRLKVPPPLRLRRGLPMPRAHTGLRGGPTRRWRGSRRQRSIVDAKRQPRRGDKSGQNQVESSRIESTRTDGTHSRNAAHILMQADAMLGGGLATFVGYKQATHETTSNTATTVCAETCAPPDSSDRAATLLNALHETQAERLRKPASSDKRVRDRAFTGLSYPEARLGRGMRLLPRAITLFTRVAGCSGRPGALSLHAAVRVTLMVLSRRSREMCI